MESSYEINLSEVLKIIKSDLVYLSFISNPNRECMSHIYINNTTFFTYLRTYVVRIKVVVMQCITVRFYNSKESNTFDLLKLLYMLVKAHEKLVKLFQIYGSTDEQTNKYIF